MESWIIGVVLAVVVVLPIGYFLLMVCRNKKEKEDEKKDKRAVALSEALEKSQQHLKYKNTMKLIYGIDIAISLCCVLTLILFFFLPIFKIELKIFDVAVEERGFSIYDNFVAMKKANSGTQNSLGTDYYGQLLIFLIPATILFWATLNFFAYSRDAFLDTDRFSKNIFKKIKLGKYWSVRTGFQDALELCFVFVCQVLFIFACKNTESKNVFQSDFVFCNGVTGYIVLPIIFFISIITLLGFSIYLQKKFKNNIKNEIVQLPKEKKEEANENCD